MHYNVQQQQHKSHNITNIIYTVCQKTSTFLFPKVKWPQYTGKLRKCTSYWCQIFTAVHTQVMQLHSHHPLAQ